MFNSRSWRAISFSVFTIAVVFIFTLIPLQSNAQNHLPLITSQPTLVVTTDQSYQYQLLSTDQDNDSITYSLTTSPSGMTIADGLIKWQPTMPGAYNVVVQAANNQNGFDSQSWKITVTVGDISSIVITPNDRPTIVNIGDNQQFVAMAYDLNANEVTDAIFTWSTDDKFSSADQNGLLIGTLGGITYIAAESDGVKASIGVVIKDIRQDLTSVEETPVVEAEETSADEPADDTPVDTTASTTTEDTTDETLFSEEVVAGVGETDEEIDEDEEPCNNIIQWIAFLILGIYLVVMVLFFKYETKYKSNSWWIFPFLLTFIGLLVYYKNFCPQTYLWWPWILVATGVGLTIYYKLIRKDSSSPEDQNELPF